MLYPKIEGWIINHLLNSTVLVLKNMFYSLLYIIYLLDCFFYVAGVSTKCLYIDYFTFGCKIHALIRCMARVAYFCNEFCEKNVYAFFFHYGVSIWLLI